RQARGSRIYIRQPVFSHRWLRVDCAELVGARGSRSQPLSQYLRLHGASRSTSSDPPRARGRGENFLVNVRSCSAAKIGYHRQFTVSVQSPFDLQASKSVRSVSKVGFRNNRGLGLSPGRGMLEAGCFRYMNHAPFTNWASTIGGIYVESDRFG